jgi:putative ABC transport system permease protein
MIKNHIKIAWRQLIKNKVFSVINVLGLALSLSAFWLLALYVADELSYDRYHENAEHIYRLSSHGKWDNNEFNITGTSGPTASALKSEYPEIAQTVRLDAEGGGIISYEQKHIKVDDIFFADKSFFEIFSVDFLAGNPLTALTRPQSIVLTKDLAIKLFGSTERALNKTLTFDKNSPTLVTAVIDNIPGNSHFTYSGLRSFPDDYKTEWGDFSLYTYILLKKNADPVMLQNKLPGFVKKHLHNPAYEVNYSLKLQPLTSIHLHSALSYEIGSNKSMQLIYVLSAIGLLILLIAFINYTNITTARASTRIREIAVRKVLGSERKNLISLFLTESVLLILIAALLSLVLVNVSIHSFNGLTAKELNMWKFGLPETLLVLTGLSLFIAVIGGLYPAIFMSGFKTISSLKNQMDDLTFQILFRKSLVVFQFTITIIMIVCSMVIYRQLNFMLHKNLGFNKNQVLTFHIDDVKIRQKIHELETALAASSAIKGIAVAGNPIGNNNIGMGSFNVEHQGAIDPNTTLAYTLQVDENFIPTMEITLLQGRNFQPLYSRDSTQALIINEAFANKWGWQNAINKRIQFGEDNAGKPMIARVIGVVKNFHIYSLQHQIEPMVLQLPSSNIQKDNLYIRIDPQHTKSTLNFIEQTFKKFSPDSPFDYQFLDQNFQKQYLAEERQGKILLIFTLLTISIACLGLFGLIAFTAQQRVKEIGIRKVLGASISQVVSLLSADLLKLVLLSTLIATPIAFFIMQLWLENFAYRTTISWWIFAAAGSIAVLIAMLTLSFQAIKAAIANPVKSLRSE